MGKTIVSVDTRNYNRRDFVEGLVFNADPHRECKSADQIVDAIDESVEVMDFDGEIMDVSRWSSDIQKIISE